MPATSPTWDPQQYLRHAGHRARAFVDLLAHVPEPPANAPRIADLGCGPGNVTRLLADRWPTAHITGYDNSPEMLDRAHVDHEGPTPGGGRIDFAAADVRTWAPPEPYDLIVSNATFQWVPGHLDRFPAWIDALAPGGAFAFQVPGNFDEPSHTIRTDIADRTPYAEHVRDVAVPSSHEPVDYLRVLLALGCEADVWETTYLHVLTGPDPVFDWVSGTGARPTIQALPEELRGEFEDEFRRLLREAYPADTSGRVVLPFRRIFAVARKAAS